MKDYTTPLFPLPEPNLPFLKTDEKLYHYHHLYAFASQLEKVLQGEGWTQGMNRPLLLTAEPDPKLIFLIAASFILKVPVLPLHPKISAGELTKIITLTDPLLQFSNEGVSHPLFRERQLSVTMIDSSLNSGDDFIHATHFTDPDLTAGLFLTSGSTGAPKLVPLKRSQIFHAAKASSTLLKPQRNRYWLLCLPLNHIGGVSIVYRSLLHHSVIRFQKRFDSEESARLLIHEKEIEGASMVPTMLHQLLKRADFAPHDDFRAILLGGGPISELLIKRARSRAIPLITSYGMTETAAQIAAKPFFNRDSHSAASEIYHSGEVGKVFHPNEIQIRNETGEPLSPGQSGRIWLKGPQLFEGYFSESETDAFDSERWFDTGDYGCLSERHELTIETRREDRIISGGENIHPAVVEEALEELTEVNRAAVIGVEDETWGQKVVAFAEPAPDTHPDPEQLREQLKSTLLPHQIPREIILMKSLPVSDALKFKKSELRVIYSERKTS